MNTATSQLYDRIGLRAPLAFAAIILIGFGLIYALTGTSVGRLLFPRQALGSLVEVEGRVVGSTLMAQPFAADRYFQPRPSAASYDPMAAAGSNQSRSNPDLRARIEATVTEVAAREGIAAAAVPSDLATQSGGGFDPHLSPEAAGIQVARVARARGVPAAQISALLVTYTEPPQFGGLGAPRVNVLALNLALDAVQ